MNNRGASSHHAASCVKQTEQNLGGACSGFGASAEWGYKRRYPPATFCCHPANLILGRFVADAAERRAIDTSEMTANQLRQYQALLRALREDIHKTGLSHATTWIIAMRASKSKTK
jgi:hypothetical protein